MKVKVTLEVEIADNYEDKGSEDNAVMTELFLMGEDVRNKDDDFVCDKWKIKWEEIDKK